MKVLVFGASGYIGTEICNSLNANNIAYKTGSRNPDTDFRYNLLDNSGMSIPKDCNYLIFCAGLGGKSVEDNLQVSRQVNLVGSKYLLDKFLKANYNIIYLSSSAVYNAEQQYASIEIAPNPVTEYGKQKFEIENYLLEHPRVSSTVTIIRPTKVLDRYAKLFRTWKKSALTHNEIRLNSLINWSPISNKFLANQIVRTLGFSNDHIIHISGSQLLTLNDIYNGFTSKLAFNISTESILSFYRNINEIPNQATILQTSKGAKNSFSTLQTSEEFFSDI